MTNSPPKPKNAKNSGIGKKGDHEALMTLTERKTRKEILFRLSGKDCASINAIIQRLRAPYGHLFPLVFKTIPADKGSEFAELSQALKDVEAKVCFTHPYSSFERGTNERHNGLNRRFIPKGKAGTSLSDGAITYAEH